MRLPTIDIVIRSFHRDQAWLARALKAIDRHAGGHRRVVVIVPRSSLARMDMEPASLCGNASLQVCEDHDDDYLGQQITKLHADLHTDADFILHLDSDQILTADCDLRSRLFDQGRLRMGFDRSGLRPADDGWRACPERFFGRSFDIDLAVPLPLAVPRGIYPALRQHSRHAHGMPMAAYARAVGADRFCEMALLRAQALLAHGNDLCWFEASREPLLPECRTYWSRGMAPPAAA